jgi:hypothetical protein
MRPTLKQMRGLAPLALEIAALRAVAETLRANVDAIRAAVLAESDYRSRYDATNRITSPRFDWTMSETCFTSYDAIVRARVEAAGMSAPPEHCPALVAEEALRRAEWRMIEATAPMFGITPDEVNCDLKDRRRWVDLTCSAALAA